MRFCTSCIHALRFIKWKMVTKSLFIEICFSLREPCLFIFDFRSFICPRITEGSGGFDRIGKRTFKADWRFQRFDWITQSTRWPSLPYDKWLHERREYLHLHWQIQKSSCGFLRCVNRFLSFFCISYSFLWFLFYSAMKTKKMLRSSKHTRRSFVG